MGEFGQRSEGYMLFFVGGMNAFMASDGPQRGGSWFIEEGLTVPPVNPANNTAHMHAERYCR